MSLVDRFPAVPDLAQWAEDWLLSIASKTSGRTIPTYRASIAALLVWLVDNAPAVATVDQVTAQHVARWQQDLMQQGRATSTRQARLRAVKMWFDWLVAESADSGVTSNPAGRVPMPTADQVPVEPADEQAVVAVLDVTGKGKDFLSRRDHALIRVLVDCGLRRSEAAALTVDDLDVGARIIRVHLGKGRKTRITTFGDRTAAALSAYIRTRRTHLAKRGLTASALFCTTNGKAVTGGVVGEVLARRCRQADVPVIKPHSLRHRWAVNAKRDGLADGDLEVLGGWSRGSGMVARYGSAVATETALHNAARVRQDRY